MKIIVILTVAFSPIFLMAKENCSDKAKVAAVEAVKETLLNDWLGDNKIGSNSIQIQLGIPRKQVSSDFPKGVVEGFWVPIKISSAKEKWEREQLFLFGKGCTRNNMAELIAGLRVEKKLKSKMK